MFPLSDSIKSNSFPIFNLLLVIATVYVFYLQLTGDSDAIIYTYALIPALIDFSNTATLIPFVSAVFLHGGFLHIILNMWFLWVFGDDVEGHLGKLTYLFLYFASGIAGNFVQYFLSPTSDIPVLGASGAVAGVLGAYYVLFPHSKIKTVVPIFGFVTIMNIGAPIMLGYWFVLQLLSGAASLPTAGETGGVAFWAHIGGFVTGFIIGKVLQNKGEIATT